MGITESHAIEEKYYGFRIYRLNPFGPLFKAGLRELEDFIIPPDEVFDNNIPFYEFVRRNANKPVNLQIYSVSKRVFFHVDLIPNNTWGTPEDGFLGAAVRYENWSSAHHNLLRVIRVKEGSNAEKMGLVANEDYIIALKAEGGDIITLNNDNIDPLTNFSNILATSVGKNIEFFVYNFKTGAKTCSVQLVEKNNEILGCDVAYGKLHEFPKVIEMIDVNRKDDGERLRNAIESLDVSPMKEKRVDTESDASSEKSSEQCIVEHGSDEKLEEDLGTKAEGAIKEQDKDVEHKEVELLSNEPEKDIPDKDTINEVSEKADEKMEEIKTEDKGSEITGTEEIKNEETRNDNEEKAEDVGIKDDKTAEEKQ
jgi:hypothetical protein